MIALRTMRSKLFGFTTSIMTARRSFHLDKSFVKKYTEVVPPFGFNGLGELVYLRTYSRLKTDGYHEKWYETVERVVNGCFSLLEIHSRKVGETEDHKKLKLEAEAMYDRIFHMKILPPGRGLWAMGSPITEDRKMYAALNNCAFVSTLPTETSSFSDPFCFLMDACMLGVGVGFDTRGVGTFEIHAPVDSDFNFVIPDSREGWVDSVRVLLDSYFHPNCDKVHFDYSLIRPRGKPIKGFGGITAGPEPLIDLHSRLIKVLETQVGSKINVRTIVDIMNLIGKAVVSGNVRRTAEIAFGEPDDVDYISLKDYDLNPERVEYGWTSNNSVFAKIGMDYSDIVDKIIKNGEPGFAWLNNMRKYGRLADSENHSDNIEILGGNPCLEQTLHSYELCNLVEVFPAKHESISDFKQSLRLAFLYSKLVTLGEVHWPASKQIMTKNRRIGCSLSGIQQFLSQHKSDTAILKEWCNEGYTFLKQYDRELSKALGINESIKITSIKPSGTVSLVAGATPGLHLPQSRFYIRRVRLGKASDLAKELASRNYDVEDDTYDSNSSVVSFPIDAGESVDTLDSIDFSVEKQVHLAALLQRYWADNQVSCTVTFSLKNGEDAARKELLHSLNYYQHHLKGISFLPHLEEGAYVQMPYETISQDRYNEMISKLKGAPIDPGKEIENDVQAAAFCDTDVCIRQNI